MKLVTLTILLFLTLTVEGKVVHLRPGAELPVMLSISMQNVLDNSSVTVSGYTWSTTNPNISIRSKSKYACTLYASGMLNGGEATLKYWVTYLAGYRSETYETTWTIKVSPLGDRSTWRDIEEGDFFQDFTEENHLVLFQLNNRWGELCADITSYRSEKSCVSTSVSGKVTIPNYVQGYPVLWIGDNAFKNIPDLTDIVLPSTCKWVNNYFINNCNNLKTLTCLATTPPDVSGSKIDNYFLLWNTVLYVPVGCKKKYKGSKGWKDFKTIKEIGEEIIDVPIDETHFPDTNFRNYLLSQDFGKDGLITDSEIDNITTLEGIVYENELESLKGIEFFTSLQELYLAWQSIGSLDISNNIELTSLTCIHCGLSSLDVSQNTALITLDCSANGGLTLLKVSANSSLKNLYCQGTKIKGSKMDELINSLPRRSSNDGKFYAVYDTEYDRVRVTKNQVAAAKARGWTVYCNDDSRNWIEYEGYDPVSLYDLTGDGKIDEADIQFVVSYIMNTQGKRIERMKADINGDNAVNVADIVEFVEIIKNLQQQ